MNDEEVRVIIVVLSALAGGFITLVVTYLNNKTKRFELEYNYRKRLEEKYLSNAQNHLNDVYIPLYSKLIVFQNNWKKLKISNNIQNIENEIYELENFKKDLEEAGLTAFLTPEVESSFDNLINFLFKSQNSSEVGYGIFEKIKILGHEQSSYRVLPKLRGRRSLIIYRIYKIFLDLTKYISWTFVMGWVDHDLKIILDSAPVNSKDFDERLSELLRDMKEKIKDITLGTK